MVGTADKDPALKNPQQRRDDAMEQIGENYKRNRESLQRDVRHEWTEPLQAGDLTRQTKQHVIVLEFEEAAKAMARWGNKSACHIKENQEQYIEDRRDYEKAIGRAIRLGLLEFPDVKLWLADRRSLGERDILRKVKKGLETGTSRPLSKEGFWVKYHAIRLYEKGRKPEEIRRNLINKLQLEMPEHWFDLTAEECSRLRDRLKRSTRQNFHEWLKRLGVI